MVDDPAGSRFPRTIFALYVGGRGWHLRFALGHGNAGGRGAGAFSVEIHGPLFTKDQSGGSSYSPGELLSGTGTAHGRAP